MKDLYEFKSKIIHPFYHRSRAEFEKPSIDILHNDTDWHNNGALGLWCSTLPTLCEAFGEHCYQVEMCSTATTFYIEYKEFVKLCENRAQGSRGDFLIMRDELISLNVDILYIKDTYPSVGEVIILNYDKISKFYKVFEYQDKRYDIFTDFDIIK